MNTLQVNQSVALFLNIEHVLYNPDHIDLEKRFALFNSSCEMHPEIFPEILWDRVTAFSLNREALDKLILLIDKIKAVTNVHLIITSDWRLNRTTEQLKNDILIFPPFSTCSVDKIDDKPQNHHFTPLSEDIALSNRIIGIQNYLAEHPNIINYAIFDAPSNALQNTFKQHFIVIDSKKLLTDENTAQAFQQMILGAVDLLITC